MYANRNSLPILSIDDLRRRAPSAFATNQHESRSDRYAFIPTTRVIEALRDNGFHPIQAAQSRSRMGRYNHTKHMIKFARTDGAQALQVGDSVPHVALVNSHDGSSAYSLIAGLFRLVCLNGLMVADSCVQSVKVPHSGDVVNRVIEGSYSVIDGASRAAEVSRDWQTIAMTDADRHAFNHAAALLRWEDENGALAAPIDVRNMDAPRRMDDRKNDLWTTFNRVQENMLRGGQRGRNANGRRFTVRPVAAIDGNVKLNRGLWSLAEYFAAQKTTAQAA